MRFFTSDTHFGHENIIRLCDRPFDSVDEMNETMIENWNNVVGEDDEVFHLGDVALGPWVAWDSILTRLNGHKTLVVGNHERIFKGQPEKQRAKFAPEYEKWFDEIVHNVEDFELSDGTAVSLSHFPYENDHTADARYREFRLADKGQTLIHGHTHLNKVSSRSNAGTLQIHVGADAFNFTPVSEEQVITLIRSQDALLS